MPGRFAVSAAGHPIADQDVVVIQAWGVHPQVAQVDTGLLGEHLIAGTTAGEANNSATGNEANTIGVNLVNSSTYTRVTAADTHGAVAFIKVGG